MDSAIYPISTGNSDRSPVSHHGNTENPPNTVPGTSPYNQPSTHWSELHVHVIACEEMKSSQKSMTLCEIEEENHCKAYISIAAGGSHSHLDYPKVHGERKRMHRKEI